MTLKSPFDPAQAVSLLHEITTLETRVLELREAARQAQSILTRAECELANKRTTFTRLVEGHLDKRALALPARLEAVS